MSFFKENFITILLISLILIILFGIVFFMYKISNDYNKEKIDIAEIPKYEPIIDDSKNIVEKEKESKVVNSSSTETRNKQTTLNKIANIFNNCNVSREMIEEGYTMNAIATENKIIINSSGKGVSFNVEFILENNILYTEITYNQVDNRIAFSRMTLAVILVDCVAQLKGHEDRALSKALSDEAAKYYTIDNEGVELKQLADKQCVLLEADLNSDFSFLNDR